MIKRFDVDDIARILTFDDHIEDSFPCDKGEWVQWLMGLVDDPRYLIIGAEKSYLVAVDTIQMPISDSVNIIFGYSKEGNIPELIKEVKEWAKGRGAKRVLYVTNQKDLFNKYGKQFGVYGGWIL